LSIEKLSIVNDFIAYKFRLVDARLFSPSDPEKEEETMAETLGSLIDKLTIANIRLWHLEDVRRDRSLTDGERLKAADAISVVNSQRNDLMDEIDEFLYLAAAGKVKLKTPHVKIYRKFQLTDAEQQAADELARTVTRSKTKKPTPKKAKKA
jgi:hypothetical protein